MRNKNSCLSLANPILVDKDSTIIFDLNNNIDTKISVAACYAPSHKDDEDYFLHVKEILDTRPSPYQLMLGDFNTVLDYTKDQSGYITDPHTKTRAVLQTWEEEEELVDCYRQEHPNEICYTFRTKSHLKKARLDYALASPPLLEHIVSIDHHYIDEELTDHSATVIKVDITKYPKGPGVFRAHPLIEQNKTYASLISNTIRAAILDNIEDKDQTIHDNIQILKTKCSLQEELHTIVQLQKNHKWETRDRQTELTTKIVELSLQEVQQETLLKDYKLSTSYSGILTQIISHIQQETIHFQKLLFSERKATKRKLNTLMNKYCNDENPSSQRAFYQARGELRGMEEEELIEQAQKLAAFHLLNDELPSKAFINIESKKVGYHEIIKLEIPNPNKPSPKEPDKQASKISITEPEELRSTMKEFYQDIFNRQAHVKDSQKDLEDFLKNEEDPEPWKELLNRKIPQDMSDKMEGLIDVQQLTNALEKRLKPKSAPGIDGLTIAWIKVFWPSLKLIVTNAINECKSKKSLSGTFRSALFKLLRKGQKDPTNPGNFRPISLLSAFYKLASCVITDRMKTAIEHVIGISQKAYITTNNIGSCLINLLSLMEHVNQKKIASLILLVDFKKAFDSITHNFIQTVLKSLNFGKDICDWVLLFFGNRCGYIMMGGHLTDQIILEQGVPQGDIISPFIFILCVEILLIKITKTKHITGITYGSREDRANTYADDTTFFMLRTENNLRNTMKILEDFEKLSGLQCNIDKTKCVPIGGNYDLNNKICPDIKLEWASSFTILGLEVDQKLEKLGNNFNRLHAKCKTIINSWKGKQLTIQGRITIANTLILPQFTYYCAILDTLHNGQINKIEHMVYNFIQNNAEPTEKRKRWIPEEIMFAPKHLGGLGCIRVKDFITSIKVTWIRRYAIQNYNDHWADLLDNMLGVNSKNRRWILSWGHKAFDSCVQAGKIVLSEMISCLSYFSQQFPAPIESNDNTWINQPIFYNDAIRRSEPTPGKPNRTVTLKHGEYGLSQCTKGTSLSMCYKGGIFKSKEDLEATLGESLLPLNYSNLRYHIKSNIGPNKRFEAVPIPNKKVPKHIKQSLPEFIAAAKHGSKPYRKILLRTLPPITNCRLSERWNKRLKTNTLDDNLVKHGLKLIYNRWIPHKYGDLKARIILAKTQFNNQLSHHKIDERDKFCDHCKTGNPTDIPVENAEHALLSCPYVNPIYSQTFWALDLSDHIPSPITAQDVIFGIRGENKPENYPMATINAILMILISYIMKCRFLTKIPNQYEVQEEIRTVFQASITAFPKRKLAMEIKGLDLANFLASNPLPPYPLADNSS